MIQKLDKDSIRKLKSNIPINIDSKILNKNTWKSAAYQKELYTKIKWDSFQEWIEWKGKFMYTSNEQLEKEN